MCNRKSKINQITLNDNDELIQTNICTYLLVRIFNKAVIKVSEVICLICYNKLATRAAFIAALEPKPVKAGTNMNDTAPDHPARGETRVSQSTFRGRGFSVDKQPHSPIRGLQLRPPSALTPLPAN